MQNYAQKELGEAVAYLAEARALEEALRDILRALELGEPVQISLRSKSATATALCPNKAAAKVADKLLVQATARVTALEKQELYWAQELVMVARQDELNEAARAERHAASTAERIASGDPSAPHTPTPTE